jgi:hypothetical protein
MDRLMRRMDRLMRRMDRSLRKRAEATGPPSS